MEERKCALVVDDNDLFRESVADLLEEAGFHALLASSPEEALALSEDESVHVILCDLVLPTDFTTDDEDEFEMDEDDAGSAMVGVSAIHSFKKHYPGVPVIAMSGVADNATLQAMSTFGAKDSLKKPFSLDELTNTLSRVVQ